MFSRPAVAALGVALLLVTAGFVTPTTGNAANQQRPVDDTTVIRVSATGTVEADPDEALVDVAIVATGADANAVRRQLASNATGMRDALAAAGIEEDAIRTTFFDISPVFNDTREGRVLVGYEGTQAFQLTISNVSEAGAIIDTAVTNGANRVDGVTFTLAEETRRDLRRDALTEAVQIARIDAETIAAAENLSIVGVASVDTSEPDFGPVRAETFAEAEAAEPQTVIESGPITVTASVRVAYNATAR